MNDDNNTTSQAVAALEAFQDGHRKAIEFYAADQDRAAEARDLRQENLRVKLALGLLQADARFVVYKRVKAGEISLFLAAPSLDEVKASIVASQGGVGSLFAGNLADLLIQVQPDPAETSLVVISIGRDEPMVKHGAPPAGLMETPRTQWSEDCAYLIFCLPENLAPRAQAVEDFLDVFIDPKRLLAKVCKDSILLAPPVGVVAETELRRHIAPQVDQG